MQQNQLGRSMIEMLGVLSIIGVLSVGGFSMVKKMQNSYDTNKIMEEISSFAQRSRNIVREYDTSDGDLNTYINSSKAVPEGVTLSDGKFVGTSDINYSFSLADDDEDSYRFKIEITGITEEICMQIATADWGASSTSGFRGIKVQEKDISEEPLSLGVAAGSGYCDGDNLTINLYYR